MGEFKYACVKYCTHLGRNIVMVSCFRAEGERNVECLNKAECGYDECGCRNSLMRFIPIGSESCSESMA